MAVARRGAWSVLLLLLLAGAATAGASRIARRGVAPRAPCRAETAPALRRLRGGASDAFTIGPAKAWAILFSATVFELASTGFMHKAQGFSRPVPATLSVFFYGASFYLFNLSLRGIEISVAYAVWSAVVMAALAAIGMSVLGESVTLAKVAGIGAIIVGTVLLSPSAS